jgi:hypothetical protein
MNEAAKRAAELANIRAALDYADINICTHEDTHRGGVLWTICGACDTKWADDEGGFKPSPWPKLLEAAIDELHEAMKFRQHVSVVAERIASGEYTDRDTDEALRSLILPKPKSDPLVAVLKDACRFAVKDSDVEAFRQALAKRNARIVIGDEQ